METTTHPEDFMALVCHFSLDSTRDGGHGRGRSQIYCESTYGPPVLNLDSL